VLMTQFAPYLRTTYTPKPSFRAHANPDICALPYLRPSFSAFGILHLEFCIGIRIFHFRRAFFNDVHGSED
jgi:hypothetical protein